MNKFALLAVGVMALSTLTAPKIADASLTLTLESGTDFFTIVDNGAGDTNPNADEIAFIGSVGNFTTNLVGTFSHGAVAPPLLIDLLSFNTSSSAGGTLVLNAYNTFSSPDPISSILSAIGGTIGGGSSSTLLYEVLVNGSLIGSLAFDGSTPAFSGFSVDSIVPSVAAPYVLRQRVTLVHQGAASTSFDAAVRSVPEPATLALLGMGLAGLGFAVRRRREEKMAA